MRSMFTALTLIMPRLLSMPVSFARRRHDIFFSPAHLPPLPDARLYADAFRACFLRAACHSIRFYHAITPLRRYVFFRCF